MNVGKPLKKEKRCIEEKKKAKNWIWQSHDLKYFCTWTIHYEDLNHEVQKKNGTPICSSLRKLGKASSWVSFGQKQPTPIIPTLDWLWSFWVFSPLKCCVLNQRWTWVGTVPNWVGSQVMQAVSTVQVWLIWALYRISMQCLDNHLYTDQTHVYVCIHRSNGPRHGPTTLKKLAEYEAEDHLGTHISIHAQDHQNTAELGLVRPNPGDCNQLLL